MDNLVFEESVNAEVDQSEFISKKWVYVNDSNSQNYTSQIVIDSTPLSNSGAYVSWQEGYIILPLVVEITSSAAQLPVGTAVADHCWAFKNGFWQMINSMTIEFNNQNVIQQTPFLNVFRSFMADTSFSLDDCVNEGPSIGYAIDSAGSWSYATTVSPSTAPAPGSAIRGNGVGLANNRQCPIPHVSSPVAGANITTGTVLQMSTAYAGLGSAGSVPSAGIVNPSALSGSKYACNEGFAERSLWYGYDTVVDVLGQGLVNPQSTSTTVYRSAKIVPNLAGSVAWAVYAKLRLKDLADFFNKTPLLKGSTIRFYINTNQVTVPITTTAPVLDAAGAVTTQPSIVITNTQSVSVLGGLTNPLMVASASLGQGSLPLCRTAAGEGGEGAYVLSVSIVKSPDGLYSTGLKSCRLYAPVYKMNPLAEQRYLQLAPTKKIEYMDIFQYQFDNIAASTPFNVLVSNGITDIQGVLVAPFIATSSNCNLSTVLSPFSTSGGSPDPIALTNFNILVSGVNLFLNNEYYDYEQFLQELKSSYQLNGNLTTGLTSGLISEDMFTRGKRWYYGNCSRVLPSEVGVSRSIQLQGTNASALACNLMVFVIFKRSITIDISTGARIE